MNFDDEARRWELEITHEAARLVRLGVPPWDALVQARQRVSAERRQAAAFPSSPAEKAT